MSESQQHLDYLEKKVNPIIKPLLRDLLVHKPEDVNQHIIQFCQQNSRQQENQKHIKRQTENLGKWEEEMLKQKPEKQKDSQNYIPPLSSDSNLDPDEEMDEIPLEVYKTKLRKTKKKTAISAEVYGDYNKLKNFKPRVIEKNEEQKDLIKEIMKNNFMFNSLDQKNQAIVIMAMEKKEFKDGDVVIKQGDDGSELFLVASGKLKCTKNIKDEEKFLKEYSKGEVFGELALMYNAPRAANIYSVGASVTFSLDRATFNNIIKTATIQRRQKFDAFLTNIDILSTLDSYEKDKISDVLVSQEFKKGDFIIKQGDQGDRFFLIQQGTAQAVKNKDDKEEVVFEYKENDYFGELSLLENDTRKASIRVTSDTMKVAYLEKSAFKRLLGPIEEILKRNKEKYDKYVQN